MVNFQTILHHEYDALLNQLHLSYHQISVFNHIRDCHSEKMGFNKFYCENCGYEVTHYNSCRDRNCPMCQSFQREEWINKYEERLLDVPYYHIVLTVPSELNPVIYQNQKTVYSIMFQSAARAIQDCARKTYGKVGFSCILHTWGQNLSFHPHIHCIMAGGGIVDEDGHTIFKHAPKNYLVPAKVVSRLFRGKFLDAFKSARLDFFNECEQYMNPDNFNALISDMYNKDWVVHIKEPFNNTKAVLNYIGRYTHRVAISNSRILDYSEQQHTVTFSYKDYRDHGKKKKMTLSALEFLRRFSMHILPSRFVKIRHYGFMSNQSRNRLIPICRKLIDPQSADKVCSTHEHSEPSHLDTKCSCPKCGGKLILYRFSEDFPNSS